MSNEWYTPLKYIEAARAVMGGIDLDPASCELANRTVKAARYYTKEQNGLMQPWLACSVWLNPPYGKTVQGGASYLAYFVQKTVRHFEQGDIEQAILLLPANVGTSWFLHLWTYPICFPGYRIQFHQGGTKKTGNVDFASCFIYLGPREQTFADIFSAFGPIVKRVSQPTHQPRALDLWESEVGA